MSERVVTIDGPAGSGKGTVGQQLAIRLGWHFLDSGALYRACAYVAVQNGITAERTDALLDQFERVKFETIPVSQGGEARVLLNGEDVSEAVRTAECGQLASKMAVNQNLRRALLNVQKEYCRPPGLVADGRDMGSVVFPNAMLKVYLTASLKVRSQRKFKQLKEKDISLKYDKIYKEIENRDLRDSTRSHAPLTTPEGALVVDTSSLSVDEVLQLVLDGVYVKMNTLESEAQ